MRQSERLLREGLLSVPGVGSGGFEVVSLQAGTDHFLRMDPYSAAVAFVCGLIDVKGDLVEAVRYHLARTHDGWQRQLLDAICRWAPWQVAQRWQSRAAAARNIRFHYDRSNGFYQQFLDANLVYSCAYFQDPGDSLDQAQDRKLDQICRKLKLQPGERFLDIGCGWGALILKAADKYAAQALGRTLSHHQTEYAQERIRERSLSSVASVCEGDYRDVVGEFDKIASIGMFEHVGGARLGDYFRKVYSLLAPEGLFLNHGITRPASIHSDAQTMFIARRVFPGGQIVQLEEVVHAAEGAGFEVIDVENLRRHY
ncbi:MAG: class I SAM-dependent methyltransferase, partial [Acidobacteriia bacterium]|nr:class I SAM-dependent methyltransferase [Terriglobia bacterium]